MYLYSSSQQPPSNRAESTLSSLQHSGAPETEFGGKPPIAEIFLGPAHRILDEPGAPPRRRTYVQPSCAVIAVIPNLASHLVESAEHDLPMVMEAKILIWG